MTKVEGVKLIPIDTFRDSRGSFTEIFNSNVASQIDLSHFSQTNYLESVGGAIRGLHFQNSEYGQNKLLTVLKGEIFDVILDLRKNSKSYLERDEIFLKEMNYLLFIPKGCAHGFQTISVNSQVVYQTDSNYRPQDQLGIHPLDHDLQIPWPHKNLLLSEKDSSLPYLKEFLDD